MRVNTTEVHTSLGQQFDLHPSDTIRFKFVTCLRIAPREPGTPMKLKRFTQTPIKRCLTRPTSQFLTFFAMARRSQHHHTAVVDVEDVVLVHDPPAQRQIRNELTKDETWLTTR